jgi:hypothetical protein
MAARGGLKRLAELYGLVERMRGLELAAAAGAVAEVEQAGAVEGGLLREQAGAGRAALLAGDRAGRAMAEAQREAAEVRAARLEAMRLEREQAREAARESYQASRMRMDQMESAVERIRVQAEMEAARRMQAATDDRFLSRREWVKGVEARQEEEDLSR